MSRVAGIACQANERTGDVGARRPHAVTGRLPGGAPCAPPRGGALVDADRAGRRLAGVAGDPAPRRFVL